MGTFTYETEWRQLGIWNVFVGIIVVLEHCKEGIIDNFVNWYCMKRHFVVVCGH